MIGHDELKKKYSWQKKQAHARGIDWQFTFDQWVAWWGDDIVNRGHHSGQLVMARNGDIGPYHPDNVSKKTCNINASEGNIGKIVSAESKLKMSIAAKLRPREKRSLETLKKMSNSMKGKNAKPIHTPFGQFKSLVEAAAVAKVTPNCIGWRTKKYPLEYFYIENNI